VFFDFQQLDTSDASEQGVWAPVLHPVTRQPVPGAELLIASYDSEHAKEQKRKIQKRRARTAEITPEDVEQDALDIVCSVVLDWRGIGWQGEELRFGPTNRKMLLTREPWLRRFVDAAAQETQRFLPPSSPTPSPSLNTSGDSASDQPAAS
jgi:hypothetical protein